MENISFTKMSGAGNDFIILEDFPLTPDPVFVQKLCDRRNGIGADGVITISKTANADFEMIYYNSDGKQGSLCGNGARCAIKYAYSSGLIKNTNTRFISGKNSYSGEVLDGELIRFNLNQPSGIRRNFHIDLGSKKLKVSFADTGSPHVVVFIEEINNYFGTKYDLSEIPVEGLGREIRFNKEFSPGGANVNFVSAHDGRLFIRTFERGVEAETLACGTGSVASALISCLENLVAPPVSLTTKSGEELKVNFDCQGNNYKNISLTGPARIIFTGEYKNK